MIVYYSIYLKYIAFAVVVLMLPVVALVLLKIIQRFTVGRVHSLVCLKGKTAIITGGGSGTGYETALVLASRGCRVIIADKKDATKAKEKIISITQNNEIETKYLDLTSLQSVRKFAKDINANEERLDILINGAEVSSLGNKYTDDGLHATMQVNHFGPFLLTHLLTGLLKKSAPSRIIFTSNAYAFCSTLNINTLNYPRDHPLNVFRTSIIYANSKLANIIAANGFAKRLSESGVTSNSLHPGLLNKDNFFSAPKYVGVQTLFRILRGVILMVYGKSLADGAQTTIHLALSNKLKNVTGKHFWDCRVFPTPPGAWNAKFCEDIWAASEKLVELTPEEKI